MTTEAEAIADLALAAAQAELIPVNEDGTIARLVTPAGAEVETIDLERYLDQPRRAKAAVTLLDANSLITWTRKHGDLVTATAHLPEGRDATGRAEAAEATATALYANVDTRSVVAIVNGHGPGHDRPGWSDHRATLQLTTSREWQFWTAKDRKWLDQETFAEHLEEGTPEIVQPAAADMLEIAQHFQAHTMVEFRSQQRLADGQVQFTYSEVVRASGQTQSRTDQVEVPTRFVLALAAFDGQDDSDGVELEARLQFRLRAGELSFRYLLTRPQDALRSAFLAVVDQVETGVGLRAFHGTP